MALEMHQFPYMSDNYGVLIHAPETGETAMVDAGDADAARKALAETGWKLTHILITHHHGDHTAGLSAIKAETGATVIGPAPESQPIGGLDERYGDGDEFTWAGRVCRAIHTPGHTLDMINFYFPEEGVVFTGDTLFTLGCGRVFEGDKAMMWSSLSKLIALPPETIVYSAHEYTLANAAFALSVDPNNTALVERAEAIKAMRDRGEPTSPTTMAEEMATNPFLRAADPVLRSYLGMETASDAEVFAEVRTRKDNF
ncbi:MAG: hydroxyacylglutathione hydrolase [Pseudomonadota bacterium]